MTYSKFPPNDYCDLRDKYFNLGKRFFDSFEDFFKFYTMLEAEEEHIFEVGGIKFKGYPDYVGRHKSGEIHILDYKSSAPYKGEELKKKVKQLYLYSIPIKEKYGEYPGQLVFLHIRHQKPVRIKFDIEELKRTEEWAVEQVNMLENLTEFSPNTESDFFCKFICSYRSTCQYIKRN